MMSPCVWASSPCLCCEHHPGPAVRHRRDHSLPPCTLKRRKTCWTQSAPMPDGMAAVLQVFRRHQRPVSPSGVWDNTPHVCPQPHGSGSKHACMWHFLHYSPAVSSMHRPSGCVFAGQRMRWPIPIPFEVRRRLWRPQDASPHQHHYHQHQLHHHHVAQLTSHSACLIQRG